MRNNPIIFWDRTPEGWTVRYERGDKHIDLKLYGDIRMTHREFRDMLAAVIWARRQYLRSKPCCPTCGGH